MQDVIFFSFHLRVNACTNGISLVGRKNGIFPRGTPNYHSVIVWNLKWRKDSGCRRSMMNQKCMNMNLHFMLLLNFFSSQYTYVQICWLVDNFSRNQILANALFRSWAYFYAYKWKTKFILMIQNKHTNNKLFVRCIRFILYLIVFVEFVT